MGFPGGALLSRFSGVQLCDSMDCSLPGSSAMGFSRQEYWSGLSCPPLGDLLDPEIKPKSPMAPALQSGSLPLSHWRRPTTVA